MFITACVKSKQEIQQLSQTPRSLLTHAVINILTRKAPFNKKPKLKTTDTDEESLHKVLLGAAQAQDQAQGL